jgi:hypothetical protein
MVALVLAVYLAPGLVTWLPQRMSG